MSTEQKRKELEAAGYRIDEFSTGMDYAVKALYCPDGSIWHFDSYPDDDEFIPLAYEHLQRDTKLKALEQLALEYEHPTDDTPFVFKVRDIIKQFNITADDESDNE